MWLGERARAQAEHEPRLPAPAVPASRRTGTRVGWDVHMIATPMTEGRWPVHCASDGLIPGHHPRMLLLRAHVDPFGVLKTRMNELDNLEPAAHHTDRSCTYGRR